MNTQSSQSSAPNVASLFGAAQADGALDPAAMQVVNLPGFANTIQAALGTTLDDVNASSVVLFTIVLDDSGSIEGAGNTQTLMDGANLVLDAIAATKEDGILVHMRTLNRGTICPFTPIASAPKVTAANYQADGITPLYDAMAETMGVVLAKTADFQGGGVPVRSITLFVTDGSDVGSRHFRTPESVKPAIDAALRAEQHIVSALAIDDGSTDFKNIFGRAGIQARWILTPRNNASDIRRAFVMASKSAARASVAAPGAFSTASAGGFASP